MEVVPIKDGDNNNSEERRIKEGDKLKLAGELWLVNKQYMGGAFGEVFRLVSSKNDGEVRAMKLEPRKTVAGGHLW